MIVVKFILYLLFVYIFLFSVMYLIRNLSLTSQISWVLMNCWIFAVAIQHLFVFHGECVLNQSPYKNWGMGTFAWYVTEQPVRAFFTIGLAIHFILFAVVSDMQKKPLNKVVAELKSRFWMTGAFVPLALWYFGIPGTNLFDRLLHDQGVRSYHLAGVTLMVFGILYFSNYRAPQRAALARQERSTCIS